MTLEEIQYKLQGVLNKINSQNENHYALNQSILATPPEPDNKQELVAGSKPEGIISEIFKLIEQLEKEAEFQGYNLNRTTHLVYSPKEDAKISY